MALKSKTSPVSPLILPLISFPSQTSGSHLKSPPQPPFTVSELLTCIPLGLDNLFCTRCHLFLLILRTASEPLHEVSRLTGTENGNLQKVNWAALVGIQASLPPSPWETKIRM